MAWKLREREIYESSSRFKNFDFLKCCVKDREREKEREKKKEREREIKIERYKEKENTRVVEREKLIVSTRSNTEIFYD